MTPMHAEHSPNESVHGAPHGNVNVNRFTFSKDARDLIVATVMALSIITIVILGYLLHDAYKDARTQVWLRDDALTKFTTGPYAELKSHVTALDSLINAYGLQKSLQGEQLCQAVSSSNGALRSKPR